MTSALPTAVTGRAVPAGCSLSTYSTTHTTYYELIIIIIIVIIRYRLYAVYLQLYA